MNPVSGPIPFRVAQAYGVPAPQRANPVAPITQVQRATDAAQQNPGIRRLIGGAVPGGIDFSGDTPQPSESALQMYHHPADRNAAATGVEVGRRLDIEA